MSTKETLPPEFVILYDDPDHQPEYFCGDGAQEAAEKTFADRLLKWSCYLFCKSEPLVDKSIRALHEQLTEQNKALLTRLDAAEKELEDWKKSFQGVVSELNAVKEMNKEQLQALQMWVEEETEYRSDFEALQKHHEATDAIIRDAQGQSPKDGKALLYNYEQLKKANAELVKLLTEVRDACKANPAMNNHKYDSLGIAVNAAIAKGTV